MSITIEQVEKFIQKEIDLATCCIKEAENNGMVDKEIYHHGAVDELRLILWYIRRDKRW